MLGGAFNPPHIGHLVLAHEAAFQLDLERVILVPTGEAPHKRIEPEPGPAVRLEMARRAAAGDELLEVSDLEIREDGPSYTFRTLERLSEQRPGDRIFFLMGADVASQLESWKRPERVLELASLGIAGRPGTTLDEAEAALERLGAPERAETIRMPEIAISSTRIRRRVAQRRPVRYLVPDPVIELIESAGLYREAVRA
ncbi:MAG: nicotinate-nucleotide adenylyltransferase [Solirubrobacterales bacterium]|nr:nicotinate-nucleotide adenylyltransferase [Solirubrobacterales bacterium]